MRRERVVRGVTRRATFGFAVLAAALCAAPAVGSAQASPHQSPKGILDQPPHLTGAPLCVGSAADWDTEPSDGRNEPTHTAPDYFAPDFPRFKDGLWGADIGNVGGFGGVHFRAPLHHTPVVFVHGNQADAQNWLDVMLQFAQKAGYTMQEMYALSYGGLGNWYAGAPVRMQPTQLDQDYIQQNSDVLANGGHGYADDDEVPDVCRFVEAVQWYTGSPQVDIVAHSLGVTITRRMMVLYPALAHDVVAYVGISGGNHGTTVCRGLDTSYYGCNEIAPGTQWLADLNAHGETYGPTKWMTVYDGAEGDPFFVGPDEPSPRLEGADNRAFQDFGVHVPGAWDENAGEGDYHNDQRVDPPEVATYLAFLLRNGQAGPGAARNTEQLAAQIDAQSTQRAFSYSLSSDGLCIAGFTQPACPPLQDSSSSNGPTPSASPSPSPSSAPHAIAPAALPNTAAAAAPRWPGAAVPAMVLILVSVSSPRRRRRPCAGGWSRPRA